MVTATVTASELERNFGVWHDRSMKEPVQITDHGRETAYLVSAETFQQLWSSFRKVVSPSELSDEEMAMIMAADVPDEASTKDTGHDEAGSDGRVDRGA